jgi:alpha/beta superfamily hydrolase
MKSSISRLLLFHITLVLISFPTLASKLKNDKFNETSVVLETEKGQIFGTLTIPEKFEKGQIALIIAGSGPTNRNGNNKMMKNNSLKYLAEELSKKGIASIRYDKRGIEESKSAGINEKELRFEDYINDAKDWIKFIRKDKKFTSLTIIGHSEGSLIGMIAAEEADKFISIAGIGKSSDKILKEQLNSQSKEIIENSNLIIDSLKNGNLVTSINPLLFSIFRPSVQPYLISWFKYDPQIEIKKLKIPVLIAQGTNDIQVKEEEAKLLLNAYPSAKMTIIKDMNHVLKIVKGDKEENIASYNNPDIKIAKELIQSISDFILN